MNDDDFKKLVKKEKALMNQIIKCQRNWDFSKEIPKEHIDYLNWVACNTPSKQYEAYYDIYYATKREVIEDLYQWSWGSTYKFSPPSQWRNAQMNANFYMMWVHKTPPTMYNCEPTGALQGKDNPSRIQNGLTSMGISMGLVMRAAAELGYYTGPNKYVDKSPDYNWEMEKRMGIYKECAVKKTHRIFYGLGIGYPQKGRPRNQFDDFELAIGASNGHNLTVKKPGDPDYPDNYPNSPTPVNPVNIIDVRKHKEATDPQGRVHKIPKGPSVGVNTPKFRDIKCKEIL